MKYLAVLSAILLCSPLIASGETAYRGITLSPQVSQSDIDGLASCFADGLPNIVRHQLFNHDVENQNQSEYNDWLNDALANLITLIPYYRQYGAKVVVDLHTPYLGFVDPDAYPAIHELFSNSAAQDVFISNWQTIATALSSYSDDIYGYLLLNEPATANTNLWNSLAERATVAIRAIDSATPVVILPTYGNPKYLSKLVVPVTNDMIVGVHFYPFLGFNQQCVYDDTDCALAYPTKGKKKNGVYIGGRNKKELKKKFKKVSTFKANNPQFRVAVLETAQSRYTDDVSFLKYIRDLFKIFESKGVDYLFHAWREDNVWSIEHSSDPNNNNSIGCDNERANLLESYFSRNP